MADTFRLTMAQANPTMGDLDGNAAKVRAVWTEAKAASSDLVVFPEMFIVGYNAQDLIMKPALQIAALEAIKQLAVDCADGPTIAVGGPCVKGSELYNAYFILRGGQVVHRQLKHHLPNYTVFDEQRLFSSGPLGGPYNVNDVRIGSPICEDAWFEDVSETMQEAGAEILVVPNGSPYYRDKFDRRMVHMVARVIETGLPLVYLNMVGGQDDQVFDGGSFVLNPGGELAMQLPVFDEAIAHVEFTRTDFGWRCCEDHKAVMPAGEEQDYRVSVEALRDYMRKTSFKKVLLGLSGGIDSALVATIAVDAMGAENVRCVMLPSEYTSAESLSDAKDIARRLGVRYDTVPIAAGRAAITSTLAPLFEGMEPGLAEENIQSRLRGLLLMAISNKFNEMLLTTGNKSEVAVGYSTIYGDMAGGYNPIKDMYKTRVFETSRWRNHVHRDWMKGPAGAVIPVSIIDKPPSAELRPNQKDEDSLPPYEVLDAILKMLVDEERSVAECVAGGFERETVKRVENLLYISEYKRFQSAPGVRLSKKAFWMDRRYPIVNRFRDPS
ncbi:NAD+ synthase [Pseudopelagicola sp. nBUS_20]|uniref:NAD+ synthase n=1 Tax=Pseudopelagicola sp. nBUS_20 TaxID=3395317 RepID=UPI003EBBBD71